ncbi:glycosyltransferase [Halomonas sp. MES3-P3E]|uniref:glycosyltransferase n=1 Tax=Halomonas sp. MES3-P3E TaxID=2058321 RepID=UPI000C3212FB|nr:glycosyltransferase family 2 protein [Halomonas sp. MES3-P3E]PKG54791.1 rhamnosyltransferase [Halomonas sp. MES3-P3E]
MPSTSVLSVSVAVCVPTLNPGADFARWLAIVTACLPEATLLVVDSSSEDETVALAKQAGAETLVIPRHTFNHGATRDMALRHLATSDVVVFLTQDAIPADHQALATLVQAFDNPRVGAAFGRQLPHVDATPIAAHARLFNYPPDSRLVDAGDIASLGIKAAFLSNSFAAYRRQALIDVGGFPHGTILSEDMIAGARLLNAGRALAYQADACVYHSHNYTLLEETKRYFDIGVLHAREAWLLANLGNPEGEGVRFVGSEMRYLWRLSPFSMPEAALRTLLKYVGYRLGRIEHRLPLRLKRRLSMHHRYWTL